MQKQIIARLRLLSVEQREQQLPEKNVQIEKWLNNVEQQSKHWEPASDSVSNFPVTSDRHIPILDRMDTELGSASVSGRSSTAMQAVQHPENGDLIIQRIVLLQLSMRIVDTVSEKCYNLHVSWMSEPNGEMPARVPFRRTRSRSRSCWRLDLPIAVRAYRKACRRLTILPLRRVLGQFGRQRIILNELCLSAADVRATCRGLMHETSAMYLDFSGNCLGAFGCSYVLQMLAANQAFTELRLAENCLTGAGIWSVLKHFQTYNVITVLDISGNKISDRDGSVVANIIKISPQLRVLHAHHNEFRECAGKAIGKAIEADCGLVELDLSWNHLRQRGAIGMANGLEDNSSLEYVNLGWNGFGFEGCVALSDALRHNTSLQKLDISCNRIHPPALLELMKGLLNNKVLKTLILDKNPITPSFATVLLEGIHKSPDMVLEELSLQNIVVDRDFQGIWDNIRQQRNFNVEYETSLPVTSRNRDDMMKETEMRNDYNIEPLRMLYLLKERNRAQDFFHKINKDHDEGLTPDELSMLFKESGIPVSRYIVDRIMSFMDTDNDGKIDLGEFLVGDKKIKKISRDYARNSVGDDAQYTRYSRTFRKAHIQQPTSRLKVEETQNYLSPIVSITPSPASSRRSSFNP